MESTPDPEPPDGTGGDPQQPPTYAVRSERERLLEAMLKVVAERGYAMASIDAVIDVAGVAPEKFDGLFVSKKACFLEAYDAAIDVLLAHVSTAFEGTATRPWPERTTAALEALVELVSTEADVARMAIAEAGEAGEEARLRYRGGLARLTSFLEEGREYAKSAHDLPAETGRFAIGAAIAMISNEIRAERGHELPSLLPDLTFTVLSPYIGAVAAGEEMQRVYRRAKKPG